MKKIVAIKRHDGGPTGIISLLKDGPLATICKMVPLMRKRIAKRRMIAVAPEESLKKSVAGIKESIDVVRSITFAFLLSKYA